MTWTLDWPTERGAYWFYGWRWRNGLTKTHEPKLLYVTIVHDALGTPMYICGSGYIYRSEGAYGYWMKAELPELPTFEEGQDGGG